MKKLDFTPKNVINCVDNELALLVLKLLHVSTHNHWLSFLEA